MSRDCSVFVYNQIMVRCPRETKKKKKRDISSLKNAVKKVFRSPQKFKTIILKKPEKVKFIRQRSVLSHYFSFYRDLLLVVHRGDDRNMEPSDARG